MTEYHIHVNALALSSFSRINLEGCGFVCRPFDFSTSAIAYTPKHHYSFKTKVERDFEYSYEFAKKILRIDDQFCGYGRVSL